jgi:hypothetical protein
MKPGCRSPRFQQPCRFLRRKCKISISFRDCKVVVTDTSLSARHGSMKILP